ncbi:hypothetical protein [Marinilactibacillus kalidii]|uniref:hypothetical protein n=1 Tax=Marinilactibacillus kalidii TaxID=2820274 RepID=UPI001ABE81CC|nr:hypothetical protein [Marinilactibacillus kalidii]
MIHRIRAEWLKTKHTWIPSMTFLLPFTFSLVLIGYFMTTALTITAEYEATSFLILFNLCVMIILGVFIDLITDLDRKAGRYANEFRTDLNRKNYFLVKCLSIGSYLGLTYMIAGGTFYIGSYLRETQVPINLFLLFLSISYLLMLPNVLLVLFTSYQFRMNGAVINSAFLALFGILIGTTGLGQEIWKYLPITWSIRMHYEYFPSQATGGTLLIKPLFGLTIIALLLIICIFFIERIWYNQWEAEDGSKEG